MSGLEVATVVASIVSAFGNGMDVFRRITGRKPKRRGREATFSEEEAWLRDSLEKRPQEIRQSYNHSVTRLGRRFEVGDVVAHSSLAHTLLVLNTGLLNLINHALTSKDSRTRDMSKRSLLNLSEVAALDTLRALSQLNLRLSNQVQLALPAPATQREQRREEQTTKANKRGGQGKKRPGPSPLIARGAWVRPKSGSSGASTVTGVKALNGTREKHQRSKSEPFVSRDSRPSHSRSKTSSQPQSPELSTCPCQHQQVPPLQVEDPQHRNIHEAPSPQRQPSMLLVPSDFFQSHSHDVTVAQPQPPLVPLHSRPNPNLRPRPPSAATFRTTSTKFGEIPERRTGRRMSDMAEDGQGHRQPYLLPPMVAAEEGESKRRGRGFKFWKREEKRVPIAAY